MVSVDTIRSLSPYYSLTPEEKESNEFFLACIEADRIDLACSCSSRFITREFILKYLDKIFVYRVSYPLSENRLVRDILIEQERYDLLLYMKYSLLKEIENKKVINELNRLADLEIEQGRGLSDYAKFRAMELKRYDVFTGEIPISFPYDEDFFDLYYKDILTFIDKIKDPGHYFYKKCFTEGDFEIAGRFSGSIDDSLLEETVQKYWDKALAFCENGVKGPFSRSKLLFEHYLKLGRFDRLCQFESVLLSEDFINQHEQEFLNALEQNLSGAAVSNRALFELCIKYERFELAGKFSVQLTGRDFELYGRKLIANLQKIPYSVAGDPHIFRMVLLAGRFDLIDQFFSELLTDEVLEEFGDKLVETYEFVPFGLKSNPVFLKIVLRTKKYDLVEQCYEDAFTDEIFDLPEFLEYLKVMPDSSRYKIFNNPKIIPLVIKAGRTDLYYWLLNEEELHVEDTEYLEEIVSKIDGVPTRITNNRKVYKMYLKLGKVIQCSLFGPGMFVPEEDLDEYITSLPEKASDILRVFNNPSALKRIVELGRYDLITEQNIRSDAVNDEVMMEIGDRLLFHA